MNHTQKSNPEGNYVICIKWSPTRCTLLLSIFISTSLHVSGNYVTIIRRTYCIYETLVWVAVWSTDQTVSQNFLGVTGKNDKRNLNQDNRTPGLNLSRYIILMTVIHLWAVSRYKHRVSRNTTHFI